jgi:hypothetical protein
VNAVQAKPAGGLLGGLSKNPNVSAYAKGRQMENAAALGFENAQRSQKADVDQMQQESSQRQLRSSNAASQAANQSQERIAASNANTRSSVFDTSMGFDYAALQKRRNLDLQQALLNGVARSF